MKEIKRLTRCAKGHFYDAGKYDVCPHCLSTREIPATELHAPIKSTEKSLSGAVSTPPEANVPKDAPTRYAAEMPKSVNMQPAPPVQQSREETTSMTVHYYQKALGSEPVVGWLVCVEGVHFGQDFRIKSGRNFIGRSGNMDVCLSGDTAVSRDRHAILTYDPKSNAFFVQPGETSELSYLNAKPLLEVTTIQNGDKLTVGETDLIFVPFCSKDFTWKKEDRA